METQRRHRAVNETATERPRLDCLAWAGALREEDSARAKGKEEN